MVARALTDEEIALIKKLQELAGHDALQEDLTSAMVAEMADGGMGSLRFVYPDGEAKFGRELIAASARDLDGVEPSITLNLDQDGRLFELDIWKVDFSATKRLPKPTEIIIAPYR